MNEMGVRETEKDGREEVEKVFIEWVSERETYMWYYYCEWGKGEHETR
jgi:hypothetical protein